MVLTYRALPRNSGSRTSSAIVRPDTSCNIESWDRRGRVLRASINLVVCARCPRRSRIKFFNGFREAREKARASYCR